MCPSPSCTPHPRFESPFISCPLQCWLSNFLVSEDVSRPTKAHESTGINAVLYYSNDILSKSLPEFGPYISIGITVINVIMTFPPIILIEKLGRRKLLFGSALGALLSLVVVGYGLNNGLSMAASVAIVLFVMSFAVGLGPIPFVLIPEVSPPHVSNLLGVIRLLTC